jgi:ADP-heptose:LPS heptosyltransferase
MRHEHQVRMRRISNNTRLLQWIDRRIGVPVCALLTVACRVGRLFGRRHPGAPVRNVLFVKLAEQGSTVLAHEALRLAVERFGRANVYFMVFEENRFIVDLLGLIPAENVLTVETSSAWAMARSCVRRLMEIRRLPLDACIDMEFFSRSSAAIAFLTGARRRVGFHTYFREGPYRGDLLTHRVLYNPHLHTSQTFASLVWSLDADPGRLPALAFVPPATPALSLFEPTPEERLTMHRLVERLGWSADHHLILLNANAGDLLPLRKWPEENYVALARRLLREFSDVAIAFTGSREEADRTAELVRAVGSTRCICLAGQTTLRQLMVAYGLAEVLVTNDSGPAHFATLTEIDVVALFGPETPMLFSPPGPRSHPVWAGLACSPCVNALNNRQSACRDNCCMQAITVDQVFAVVDRIYRTRTGRLAAGPTAGPCSAPI